MTLDCLMTKLLNSQGGGRRQLSACNEPCSHCAVSPAQLHGEGAVVCLAVYEGGSKPREAVLLLAVHEDSEAVVWDAR